MTKGLEALKTLKRCEWHCSKEWLENYPIVEKSLKVLEIIKEHFVNIGGTKGNFEDKKSTNEIVIALKDLTKEEYDLLKETFL